MGRQKSNFDNMLAKLAADEEKFFGNEFLCPVIAGHPLRVRLSGIVMNLRITSPVNRRNFEGWGVFRPTGTETCRFVRQASLAERRSYLEVFPRARFVICAKEYTRVLGLFYSGSKSHFIVSGLVPILFGQEMQVFDNIITRYDGANFWFDEADPTASLKNSLYLRNSLIDEVEVEKINASGLTPQERQAYAIAFLREIENKRDKNEDRLRAAIERAGAEYRSYVERGDSFTVQYTVDGQQHQSVVKKDTLEIQSAGICLSGGDRSFDLQSVVGVIRQGIRNHRIVRVGLNTNPERADDYDDYDD